MQQQPPTPARLSRDTTNHMIGGVCAGIARQYGYDVTVVRIVAILLTLVWGAGLLLYLALWVIMPADTPASNAPTSLPAPEAGTSTAAGTPFATGSADDLAERARRAADDLAIAARSAAEAARVAAEQLAEVAKAATAAGRESWEQQRAARSEAERSDTARPEANAEESAPPAPDASSIPEYETTPPPGPDDARTDAPTTPPSV